MTEVAAAVPGPARPVRPSWVAWLANPYLLIFVSALLDTIGEVLLKKGADAAPPGSTAASFFGITALASGWTWIGIISYVISLLSWLHVLRFVPLSVAFPLVNVVHVLVPLAAHVFLNEHISVGRWIGIGLILSGALLIIQPLVKAEEKL